MSKKLRYSGPMVEASARQSKALAKEVLQFLKDFDHDAHMVRGSLFSTIEVRVPRSSGGYVVHQIDFT